MTLPWACFLSDPSVIEEHISQMRQIFKYIAMGPILQVYLEECRESIICMKMAIINNSQNVNSAKEYGNLVELQQILYIRKMKVMGKELNKSLQ